MGNEVVLDRRNETERALRELALSGGTRQELDIAAGILVDSYMKHLGKDGPLGRYLYGELTAYWRGAIEALLESGAVYENDHTGELLRRI